MANGGEALLFRGVHDRKIGHGNAILGVPPEVDINRLKKSVYDSTDPHLTPVFEEIRRPRLDAELLGQGALPFPLSRLVLIEDLFGRFLGHLPELEDHVGIGGLIDAAQDHVEPGLSDVEPRREPRLESGGVGLGPDVEIVQPVEILRHRD
jgi:hypothetical protein